MSKVFSFYFSGLQTLGKDEYHDTIIEGLVSNVTSLLSVINPKVPARLLINMVASLMDNFSLGHLRFFFSHQYFIHGNHCISPY